MTDQVKTEKVFRKMDNKPFVEPFSTENYCILIISLDIIPDILA